MTCLACRVGELVAMPAAPRLAARCIEFSCPSATRTPKNSTLTTVMPRHLPDAKRLAVQGDSTVVAPVCWAQALLGKAFSVQPPRGSGLADEPCTSQRVNIDALRLFNRAPTVSAPASHAQASPELSKTFGFSLDMFSAPKCVARHQVHGFRVRSRKA